MTPATATTTITIELPTEVVALLGPPEAISYRVRKALVLDLLRDAEISQGRAARLLGITRYDILDLMARHQILSGPVTAEEARMDFEAAQEGARPVSSVAGG